jgi:hypothetical protein
MLRVNAEMNGGEKLKGLNPIWGVCSFKLNPQL